MTSTLLVNWILFLNVSLKSAFIFFISWGMGHFILKAFGVKRSHALEKVVLSLGLGLGCLSLMIFALGAAGLYRPLPLTLLLVSTSIPGLAALRKILKGARMGVPVKPEFLSGNRTAAFLLAGGVLMTWTAALSPPIFYDSLVYHLGVPNIYLIRGGISYLPRVVYANFPMAAEMIYLLGMFIGGPVAAGLLNFGIGVLSALALAAFVRRHWGWRTAIPAAALYYLTPPLFLLSRFATVENALSLFFVLAVLCLYRYVEEEALPWAVLAGVFGGLAFSVKYIGALFAVLLPAVVMVVGIRMRKDGRRGPWPVLPLAAFMAAAGILVSPWLIKNIIYTGNPFHPALYDLLGGLNWSSEQAAALAVDARSARVSASSWIDALRLPWDLIAAPGKFGAAALTTWFWPLALLSSFILLTGKRDWRENILLLFMGAYWLLWAVSFWLARFLVPAMALGGAAMAIAFERLRSRYRWFNPALLLTLLTLLNVAVLYQDPPTRKAYMPALGVQSGGEYLRSLLRIQPAVEFVNKGLPEDSRLLVLGESKVAYLRRDHLYNSALDRPVLPDLVGAGRDPREFKEALSRAGVTHVLINLKAFEWVEREYPVTRINPDMRDNFLKFLGRQARLLFSGNNVYLYEVAPAAPH